MLKTPLRTFTLFALLILSAIAFASDPVRPPKPTLIDPENGTTVNTNSPLLRWMYTGIDVETFKVVVQNAAGQRVFKKNVAASEVCDADVCTLSMVSDSVSLLNVQYTWRVTAKNAEGKTKSDPATFTVNFPGSATLLSPSEGESVTVNPSFSWELVNAAEKYRVKVRPTGGTPADNRYTSAWLDGTSICSGNICIYTFDPAIAQGTYRWSVEARQTSFPNKSKSAKNNFTFAAVK